MKVLLFSNDLMPFGNLPTSGGGLRCFQLMRGLQSHGIEVIASMPGFTYLAEKHRADIPEEQREWLWEWHTQDDLLRKARPDAVLFASNWDHFNLTRPYDVPLIVDLHGSRLIETSMWNNPASAEQKVRTFARADCLLCAGKRQRSYFYGWLVQSGRVPEDEHFIRYIPVSLSPELPEHIFPTADDDSAPVLVSGGGWFPWQNQAKTIFAACRQVAQRNRGTIRIFGTPHETATVSPEERLIRDIYSQVQTLAQSSPRIRVEGYIGRNDLIEIYRRAGVAVEAMQYNLERELAFTTRTIEYLWCGLPVLYNNYAEISEHIEEYNAGWTIDPTSDAEIALALDEILSSPKVLAEKSRNAQRLVRDRFTWDKTILPLVEFLKAPAAKLKGEEPALGAVAARPSYLSPRGTAVAVGLNETSTFSQHFIVPAENITCVSVPVSLAAADTREKIESVRLQIVDKNGAVLKRKTFPAATLPSSGQLLLNFSSLRPLRGGDRLRLEIAVFPKTNAPAGAAGEVLFQGLLESKFPFIAQQDTELAGLSLLGERIPVKAIAFHFMPGTGGMYRFRLLAERGLKMLRQGDWKRLSRAVYRRVPMITDRLKRMVFQGS